MEKKSLINIKPIKDGNDKKAKKDKISSIIFIRACSSLGIVIFHYCGHSKGYFYFLYNTANSDFGFMFVTSFFCISGFVLYYNYPKIKNIKSFYFKRWKSIFPPYYICYTYFFLKISFSNHKLFFEGQWTKLFLTIIGLDGYLSYRFKTYYLVGEWFLGAIIIIYLIYPFLILLINYNSIIINNIVLIFFYILMYNTNLFLIGKNRNIITCITSFYFGIETYRFKKIFISNRISFCFFFVVLLFLSKIHIKSGFILIYQIQGFSLFIVLFQIGKYAMKTNFNIIFIEISKLSYSIYLFHHRIIIDILSLYNPKNFYAHIPLLSITILLIIICSTIHLIVVKTVYKSYIFQKIESFFI